MSTLLLALGLLALLGFSTASHFWGGTVTFSPKGLDQNGKHKVEFRVKQTFDSCSAFTFTTCVSGDCGSTISTEQGIIYNTDGRNAHHFNWCQTESIFIKEVSSDFPFSLRESSCCWISLTNGFSNWRLLTTVNLGTRSDTSKANRSPIVTSISFVRVPQNCPRTYTLVTFDPDGDLGRCRYGTGVNDECAGCQLASGFTLIQSKINGRDFCSVHYGNASAGVYGMELVVEDFPQSNISLSYTNGSIISVGPFSSGASSLSQLPLHFAIKVDPAVATCEEGVYLPKFLDPTPANGALIQAVVNQTLEITVRATASVPGVRGLIISGPLHITTGQKNGSEEFYLRWTPRSEELDEFFPVCFVAESNKINDTFFQSEMRCVVVQVGDFTGLDIVAGLRIELQSKTSLTEMTIKETVLKQFQEELVRQGLPNSTTLTLRRVYQTNP